MSAILKVFLGLMVIVCLAQFIEMAPAPEETKLDDSTSKIINDISEQFKKAFSDENLKKLVDTASNAFSEGAKAFEGQVKDWKEKLENLDKKN